LDSKETWLAPEDTSSGASLSCTYASDDEDTVFARVKPSCSTVFARISLLAVCNKSYTFWL